MESNGIFLGLISGTSMDGVDAALIRRQDAKVEMLAARTTPYASALRKTLGVLAADAASGDVLRQLGEADVAVGKAFAHAATALLAEAGITAAEIRAIGSHGQTVLHRPDLGFSLQIGDPSRIAGETGIVTVADFRRADLAAGGEGAPLAPILHRALFADPHEPRAVLNLGGISNLTVLAPGRSVLAFDVGPANTLLDALARESTGAGYDRDGALAAAGRVHEPLLGALLADPWFALPPPKSTGPEYFNLGWVRARSESVDLGTEDLAATFAELAAAAVAGALELHGLMEAPILCCGGGVHNPELMSRLAARAPAARVTTTAAYGADPDYIEAMCFAWLAGETLAGRAGNLPEVTGAKHPAVLGAVHSP